MNQSNSHGITRRNFLKSTALASAGIDFLINRCLATTKKKQQPNILYLMTDQHRGDCLGCAGNKIIKTPHLDSIAMDGVVFSNAYSSTPSCTPARSALLTGLSP